MTHLKEYKLSEVCQKIGSGATPKGGSESYLSFGEYTLIRSQNVLDFDFAMKGLAYINELQASKLKNVEIKERDILLNITGDSVARVCQVPSMILPARVNQHVAIIRPNSDIINNEYLKYYLLEPKVKDYLLMISSSGGTRNAITKNMLEELVIKVPDLPTQTAIAEVLSSIDEKIELNNKINDELESLAQTFLKQWFVDFEFPNENGEPYKSSGGEMTDSEFGEIPKGWEITQIGDVCDLISGYPFKGDKYVKSGYYGIVTIKNVQDGKFIQDTENYINEFPSKFPDSLTLKIGDILMSLTGNVGRVCYVTKENCLLNQRVVKLNGYQNNSNSLWYYFFRQTTIKNTLISISKGTAQLNLSPVETKLLKIIFPKKIDENILGVFNEIFNNQVSCSIENNELTNLRNSLLPKLISGELEINEINN